MIKVTMLLENTNPNQKDLKAKHGLSMYVQMPGHKLLFDVGPDDTFIRNAEKLKINLANVDTVIISHGHADHGGGLAAFLKINTKAKIYIQKNAFNNFYTGLYGLKIPIGLDKTLKDNPRIILTNYFYIIDEHLQVFSEIEQNKLLSVQNNNLYVKKTGIYKKDSFVHEQNLLITYDKTNVLLTGCSHQGIYNILNKAEIVAHSNIDYVFGGMHLYSNTTKKYESSKLINNLSVALFNSKTAKFYTCHCTGPEAYDKMKDVMQGKIDYISTGDCVQIKLDKPVKK
ncbi:MAG: MBL fold metallo-hydrolase [Clostridia bacterium]